MKYQLPQIFNFEELKQLCESFGKIVGIANAIIDLEGKVFVETGWQPICTLFHRKNEITLQNCIESDTILARQANEGKRYNKYKCKNGLIDIAFPIIVDNKHIGNFFTGQFFIEEPDIEYFKKRANKYGFNETEYLQAVRQVPILKEEHIKKTIQFLILLTDIIGKTGLKNLQNLEYLDQLEAEHQRLEEKNEEIEIQNEELQKAKEHAEESDRLKTAFLQNISHEIRTPLNGILGFSKLLHDEINSLQAIREYTGIIQESGERLLSIINNVLDISKIETGQVFITKKSFSINSMLCSLFSFFKPIVHSKGIEINYIIPTTIKETWVYTDNVKLNQILTNLINNAIKFTPKGKIDFGYEIKGNFVEFFVKDTGIGISPEHQERIFDRFTQVDLTATKDFEGAGLGLAIGKGLVELLGGNIWLESKIGIGSTFYFTIPYQNTLEAEEKEPTESRGFVKKRKIILVAEDDITSYLYLEKIFKNKEFQLIHASNGKEAVRHVKNNPEIDFVLMDIAMPIMDGLEATKIIKTIRPELPIIAQTAYAFSQEREKALTAGCDDYLSKPIDSAKLLRLLVK